MKPDTLEKVLATFEQNNTYGGIYFAKFDQTVNLCLNEEISDYHKRCIETFFKQGENLFTELANASFKFFLDTKYYDGRFDELKINSPQEIWQHCTPVYIHLVACKKNPDSTFIDIKLDCYWESHSMQWLVKNESLLK